MRSFVNAQSVDPLHADVHVIVGDHDHDHDHEAIGQNPCGEVLGSLTRVTDRCQRPL